MTQCQCIKSDGKQCSRDASTKAGMNPLYCWQHQNCTTPTSGLSLQKPVPRPTPRSGQKALPRAEQRAIKREEPVATTRSIPRSVPKALPRAEQRAIKREAPVAITQSMPKSEITPPMSTLKLSNKEYLDVILPYLNKYVSFPNQKQAWTSDPKGSSIVLIGPSKIYISLENPIWPIKKEAVISKLKRAGLSQSITNNLTYKSQKSGEYYSFSEDVYDDLYKEIKGKS